MRIIKLNAIGSTNTFLRQISSAEPLDDYTVVVAQHQTNGRGQMGTEWQVQEGKNLTFSVLKKTKFVSTDDHFFISIATSLAVHSAMIRLKIPKVQIKWPNDILAENQKICGILIENVLKNNRTIASIIGIGLNVNQIDFSGLPNATSVLKLTGRNYSTEEIMHAILDDLKINFNRLKEGDLEGIKKDYESKLFRRNKPSTFKDQGNAMFSGYIQGVSRNGNLQVLLEDDIVKEYDLKEIELLY
ncbi:MAG: biotin--[acetyl-CoA-carboxylase] ligase [Bacteroidia bacterium]|nr:biotin--[acetyl-CoA-carboxylase] ligase [Bacteroidia bacterium]MBT8309626.1 biotin--[acetyl-CoA-carboxylase] ligase [Bacteroidia bacterium]NNK27305.1 biotin--[acetyl-CoA-carboxylase] ligase [Flavobacteriaceae bacterium]NNL59749.1 biotin--[acetyl-CoA-carboxylase] ligase [Flavobacteriaceae bacterium]RZV65528.1 MAG: biotin--[acetyl-CoA-carboxylase] ligase [Flavobacteriaceae bacterium]